MPHGFRKFISEVFVNGKFPKILPSENFLLYGSYTMCDKTFKGEKYCSLLTTAYFSVLIMKQENF